MLAEEKIQSKKNCKKFVRTICMHCFFFDPVIMLLLLGIRCA